MLLNQIVLRGFLMMVFVMGLNSFVSAQGEISKEELTKYVDVMDSINVLKKEFNTKLNDMVKNNENLTAKRYNEIKKGTGAKPTEAEQKAYDEIVAAITASTKDIQEKSQAMIKDKEMLGAMTYNKVRKALKSAEKADIETRMKAIRVAKGTYDENAEEEEE